MISKETKKQIRTWIIASILLALVGFKDEIVAKFQAGNNVEFTQDVHGAILNDEFIGKMFRHKETLKQVSIIKKQGEDEMIKRESERVGLRVLLSREMNVAEDNVANEIGISVKFVKFLQNKIDSVVDYRIDKWHERGRKKVKKM